LNQDPAAILGEHQVKTAIAALATGLHNVIALESKGVAHQPFELAP